MKELEFKESIKMLYFMSTALIGKLMGKNQYIFTWILFFTISIIAKYSISMALFVATIASIISLICNFPINKYLTYNLITATVSMRLVNTNKFKGKTEIEKMNILAQGYLEGIKLIKDKKIKRKIKFNTHRLVLLKLKRSFKKLGYTHYITKEEYIESSPLKEKLYLYPVKEFKNIDFNLILKDVEKYKVEIKF